MQGKGVIFGSSMVSGDGPSNAANHIFPQLTPIAMAMKFGTNWL